METTILTTCNNVTEANLIKGMLENNSIECFLVNENFSNLLPHFNGMMGSGVQIIIEKENIEKAKSLLLSQSNKNEIACPNCGSSNLTFGLGSNKIKKFLVVLISMLVFIPFGNLRNTYYCHDCKTEFQR